MITLCEILSLQMGNENISISQFNIISFYYTYIKYEIDDIIYNSG